MKITRQNTKTLKICLSTLEYYKGKVAGIKVYFDTAISDVLDISPLKEITEFAHENNLIVMVHSSNSPVPMAEMVSVLKKGDILTHAYHGGVHNASEDCYECLKIAKEKGVITDTGFAGNIHANFGVLRGAAETGCVPDCISTDITKFNAYKRGGRYGMTMCMSMAGELGMKEEDMDIIAEAIALVIESEDNIEKVLEEFKEKKPSIIFEGYDVNPIVINLNLGDKYNFPEYTSTSYDGEDLTNKVIKNIIYNSQNSDSINTNTAGIYYINYSVVDSNGYSNYATINVVIADNQKPILVIPDNVTISSNILDYDLLEGTSCTDNSGACDISFSGNISFGVPGKYIINYTASDPSGNTTILKRVITIE